MFSTITLLRSDLASVRKDIASRALALDDTGLSFTWRDAVLKACGVEPSPELASVRALSEAERAVVDAAVHVVEVWGESAVMWLPGMTSAVDALLALRKAQPNGG